MPVEIQVSPETEAALKTNLTLRCVLQAKYSDGKSRRSAVVIPWAQSVTERISKAAVQKVGQQTAGFSVQLIMIEMLVWRGLVYICYDLFLDECDPELRAKTSGKFHAKHPIHFITGKHKVFFMRRDERLDTKVFGKYLNTSSNDKGPWPLFYDGRHPPFYDFGKRLIEYEELTSNDPSWRPWHLPPMAGEVEEEGEEGEEGKEGKEGAHEQEKTTEDDGPGQAKSPH